MIPRSIRAELVCLSLYLTLYFATYYIFFLIAFFPFLQFFLWKEEGRRFESYPNPSPPLVFLILCL